MSSTTSRLGFVTLLCASSAAAAPLAPAAPAADAPLTAADRRQIVATLAQKLRARYVYPERGEAIATKLQAHAAHGDFDGARTTKALGEVLDRDLTAVGDDRHFRIRFVPEFDPALEDYNHVPGSEEIAQGRADMARRAFGIARVERLPGNVGYLDIRGFGPAEFVAPAYDQALALLAGTDALVVDLRSNGGGEPLAVSYFVSHFFTEGDERHLNDIFDRPSGKTREYWTLPVTGPRYLRPVILLTSHSTASGAEECAYDLQTQKRATLVGETTAGAANPGGPVAIGHGLVAFVPTGRPINPVTHADWEKVGVKPDLAVPAADAMKTAYLSLLDRRLAEAKDPGEKDELQDVRRRAMDGKIPLPGYVPRR
ncbi:MAG TPA: S41 family peptidase [Pseudomonadota bacterium]|nr:S41 family peptidase [Pseudomonadota bacterium]